MKKIYPYSWTLKDAKFTKDQGHVFSCFACGGGSSMGYKLAGFDIVGINEIDKKLIDAYTTNLDVEYVFDNPIQEFKNQENLPESFFHLDILDGSPPCSSFSICGRRDKDWGKKKKFREGQMNQVLDTLFFDFIDLAKRLQPKVIVAENVMGLILGNAQKYVTKIMEGFEDAGYSGQYYLMNSAKMGLPQARQRVFFIYLRNDLIPYIPLNANSLFPSMPTLDLKYNAPKVIFSEIQDKEDISENLSPNLLKLWKLRTPKDHNFSSINEREFGKTSRFSTRLIYGEKTPGTLTAGNTVHVLNDTPRHLNEKEVRLIGSFPMDYNFLTNKPHYIVGMSVPPIMMATIANEINQQWLKHIPQGI
jgi:DNA (cytosine-5)-methyltransferase 1